VKVQAARALPVKVTMAARRMHRTRIEAVAVVARLLLVLLA
jgi:hypothetical protein